MNPIAANRPSAASLLKRRQLLSSEQKQLLFEKNKAIEANRALVHQQERMKLLSPPKKRGLIRSNTWNGGH